MFILSLLVNLTFALVQLPAGHPSIYESLQKGLKLPPGHPVVNPLANPFPGHLDIDVMLKTDYKLPIGHPNVDGRFSYVTAEASKPPPPSVTTTKDSAVSSTQPLKLPAVTSWTTKAPVISHPPSTTPFANGYGTSTFVQTTVSGSTPAAQPTELPECPSGYPVSSDNPSTTTTMDSPGLYGSEVLSGPSATDSVAIYSSAISSGPMVWMFLALLF